MKTITKGLVGTVTASALAMVSASPAYAKHNRGGVDAGEVIAGALILGGIVAVASAIGNKDRDRYQDRDYNRSGYRDNDRRGYGDRNNYRSRGNARNAVEKCVRAAERRAGRYSGGRADVTDIRDVDRKRSGFNVKGRIAVNTRNHNLRRSDDRYNQSWNNNSRGRSNSRNRGYDSGKFSCKVRNGRVVDIDFSGIRGL